MTGDFLQAGPEQPFRPALTIQTASSEDPAGTRTLHLAAIVESADDAIIGKDLEGRITSWNPAAARMFGYTADEVIGRPVTLLIPPGHLAEEAGILERLRLGERIGHYETTRRRKDGTLIEVSLSLSPVRDDAGRVIGAAKIARDITLRRQTEQAAQRLAAVVEFSDDAILTKDLNGVITSWNRGAERIFGYTAEEIVGKPVTTLIPTDHLNEEPMILSRIRSGDRIQHYETIRQRKDGTLINISLTVSPLRDATGKIVGASKIARDITERRRAQDQQTLLLREMDHRVKNLFSLANSVVALSVRSAKTPRELAAAVETRLVALSRAHALTLSNPSGAAQSADRPDTLHALIRTITSAYAGQTDQGRERLTISGADLPLSANSLTALALLLHELTTNAAKYGAFSVSAGFVQIECREEPPNFVIEWKERGAPPAADPPETEGFGTILSRMTVKGQLHGTMTRAWTEEGLSITLIAPRTRLEG